MEYKSNIEHINQKMQNGYFTSKEKQKEVLKLISETYQLINQPDHELALKYFWEQVKKGNFKKMEKIFWISYWGDSKHSNSEHMGESIYVKQIFGKEWGSTWRVDNWTLEQPVQENHGGKKYYTRQPCFHKPENLNFAKITYDTLNEIHHVKEKHREFLKIMGLDVDAIYHLVELRNLAKEYQIMRPVSKEAKLTQKISQCIKEQIDQGINELKIYERLPITCNSHYCSNWNGTKWIRTIWFYNFKLTKYSTIIEIIKKAIEDGVIDEELKFIKN